MPSCWGKGELYHSFKQTLLTNKHQKIYATVGSEEKIQYLVEHCSLSRDDIFNSRDDSFVQGVIKATSGKGVDIVLNSLAAKLLHASWQCVASFGKMIELGKIDFSTNASLSMTPFAKNRAFIGVDLLDLASERPDLLKRYVVKQFFYENIGLTISYCCMQLTAGCSGMVPRRKT